MNAFGSSVAGMASLLKTRDRVDTMVKAQRNSSYEIGILESGRFRYGDSGSLTKLS